MEIVRENIKGKINDRFSNLVANFDTSSNLLTMPKDKIDGEIISGPVTSSNMHGKYGHVQSVGIIPAHDNHKQHKVYNRSTTLRKINNHV